MKVLFSFQRGVRNVCWCHVAGIMCKVEQHGSRVDVMKQTAQPTGEYDTHSCRSAAECVEVLTQHGFHHGDVLFCLHMLQRLDEYVEPQFAAP